ncbi:hypothetical protein RJ639_042354 [Escallonia herrerae]|uniref:Uncharacterized protein n=1 Tax=Escallonia herrerae TaxID=1293975 RepID=A0AA88WID6_9ASTE|nr:hypothetical protein RJ639_042354 [Escallonia herrerae]
MWLVCSGVLEVPRGLCGPDCGGRFSIAACNFSMDYCIARITAIRSVWLSGGVVFVTSVVVTPVVGSSSTPTVCSGCKTVFANGVNVTAGGTTAMDAGAVTTVVGHFGLLLSSYQTQPPRKAMPNNGAHILVYPYPALGHIIPLLDLTHLLLTRGLHVTVLLAPTHLPLLDPLLSTHPSTSLQALVLTPPDPPPSSQFKIIGKMSAMAQLYDPILHWFESHPNPPVAIVSDFFLGWTNRLASHLGVPRVVFWPSGAFAALIAGSLWRDVPKNEDPSSHESFLLSFPGVPNSPSFPWWQISQLYREYKEGDPDWEFFRDAFLANSESWGVVFNSFAELERTYIDGVTRDVGHTRVWAVGPLMPPGDDSTGALIRGGSCKVPTHELMTWLDGKRDGKVVYLCFGSRLDLSNKQMEVVPDSVDLARTLVESVSGARPERDRAMKLRGAAYEATNDNATLFFHLDLLNCETIKTGNGRDIQLWEDLHIPDTDQAQMQNLRLNHDDLKVVANVKINNPWSYALMNELFPRPIAN